MPSLKEKKSRFVMESVDFGTPQLKNHFSIEIHGNGRRAYAKVLNHPLDYYYKQSFISLEQYKAGCDIFNDYQRSHSNKNSFSLIGVDKVDGGLVESESPHSALERYMRVIASLNRISRLLAIKVCVEGYFVKDIARGLDWAKLNSGMDRFKETLDELEEFYTSEFKNRLTA